MAEGLNKQHVNNTGQGLNSEMSPDLQKEGTQRFVLNGINESNEGELLTLSNELGNKLVVSLPDGYTVLSKLYTENKKVVLFLTNGTDSEIGVFDGENDKYTTYINDNLSTTKLNFSDLYPIDSIYRLRRGCERTVYFTDYNNPPRVVNLDSLTDYNTNNVFDADKTNLFRNTNVIPYFKEVEVLDSGGQLLPGSYNVAIQYLDESLNPTEWLNTSDTVIIYNDSLLKEYKKIKGSINSLEEGLGFGNTNKSIKVEIDNLDPNFLYYRLAFIESTSGNGQISKVSLTDVISTKKDTFIYTGNNIVNTTTEAEIIAEKLVISKAKHILQIENTLLLGDTKGSEIPFCNLQQYASAITADLVLKTVVLDDIKSPNSGKNPSLHINGQGYTPGEIYSFGIQYVFENGEKSPVYHIPGKALADKDTVFSPGDKVYPMSADNLSLNTRYVENDSCGEFDYWGRDYRNRRLKDTPVRHHRFPLRSELNLDLVKVSNVSTVDETSLNINVAYSGTTKVYIDCEGETNCTPRYVPNTVIEITYTLNGEVFTVSYEIDYVRFYDGVNTDPNIQGSINIPLPPADNAEVISFTERSFLETEEENYTFTDTGGVSPYTGITYDVDITERHTTKTTKQYTTDIFGIKFSNVVLPSENITGKKVVGYEIVRNERTEAEKTILDSAVLTPCVKNEKYISHGLLFPVIGNLPGNTSYDNLTWSVIHPEHKFFDRRIQGYSSIIQEGSFYVTSRKESVIRFEDVVDGSSFDPEVHKNNEKDDDGLDIKIAVRDNELTFNGFKGFTINSTQVDDLFYLDALESRDINNGQNTVYNIAGDNKVGILHLKEQIPTLTPFPNVAYYVIFKRNNFDSYSNFRNLEYYKEHDNYATANTIELFHGDSYVSPMRYANTVFWDIQLTKRSGKSSIWKKLLGVLAIAGGIVLSIFTGGTSAALVGLGAGLLVAGTGAMMLASGIKRDNWNKAYGEEYDKGLRETALDDFVNRTFRRRNGIDLIPPDDEIQWIGEVATNFWFESQVNISVRHGFVGDLPAFLEAPGVIQTGNNTPETFYTLNGITKLANNERYPISDVEFYFASKLLYFDPDRKSGRAYLGHSLGEYYKINPDYLRRNKQKIFYHLPLEYDCCSECNEEFPHRWHWSQQSFQEELTDNYRVFLPNNYKDIDAETGRITNMFKINNDLFIHTEGALYLVPRNYQERITDQIVSFIGTGELFSIPPQKISDNNTFTGGTNLKWANVKTIYGYFFASDVDNAVYLFNGQNLKKISDVSIKRELEELLEIKGNKEYYLNHGTNSEYLDKPSAINGLGIHMVYDERFRRVIITKIDKVNGMNNGFTISFDLKTQNWCSYHSYIPYMYLQVPLDFYSLKGNNIYKHNIEGLHNQFYGETKPFIIEFVSNSNPLQNTTTEDVSFHSIIYQYDEETKEYYQIDNRFFNKMIAYNGKQCTGLINLKIKDNSEEDFFKSSFSDLDFNDANISCKENIWRINEFRDSRVIYNKPIFIKDLESKQSNYFIDKILNETTIDTNKEWSEKQMLRDKYLIVRLIFDNFVDTKIVTNFSVKNETISVR